MKVFFTASYRGVNNHSSTYKKIYSIISDLGHTHLSNRVIQNDISTLLQTNEEEMAKIYKESVQAVKNCDICIVEVSVHSMSAGYLIDRALESGKPVIVLHPSGKEPYFFSGIKNDRLHIWEYTDDDLKVVVGQAIDDTRDQMDVRFNFFVSPKIVNYLDWISKKKRMPRAVYLRRLIEIDMKAIPEYE